jgi:hypothetical protein
VPYAWVRVWQLAPRRVPVGGGPFKTHGSP